MNEVRVWQPWRLGQLWRLWRLTSLWRLWRLPQATWVRPLLGFAAALALVVGGVTLLCPYDEPTPTAPYQIRTEPIIQPLPTNHWPGQGN
ncbi:hypothetical protein ACIA8C_21095 [Nocardia sp. NPDC051321]|uniref:hypothetical protein n=1 Tax=Nocardia sp. NPDC051321 TaxID=3364323 RepID=UPI0037B6BE9C